MDLSSLVIRLSADVATLQSDFGKAVNMSQRAAADMTSGFQKVGDTVRDVAKGLAAAFTVDKILEVGKAAIDLADDFNKMSQKVGVSVESLSALNVQARLADVPLDALQGGLAKLAKNATDAASGGKEQAATFAAMGVSLKDANGNLRSTESLLGDVAKKFAGYDDSASKTALAQKLFGKTGADLIPLLNQLGEQGFKKVREEAEHFGQVISKETAAQAEEFNDNLTKTQFGLTAIVNTIVADLLPSLVDTSRAFSEWINSDAVRNGVAGLVEGITGLVRALIQVPGELAEIDLAFRKWNGTVSESNGGIDALLNKLKSFTNFKIGAPVTFSWSPPAWLKWLDTPTAGSGLDARMTEQLTKPINDLGSTLKLIVPNIDSASKGLDGLAQHMDATAGATKKTAAPLIGMADAADKARDAAKTFIEQLEKEVATYGMSQLESKRYEAAHKDLTASQRDLANALLDTLSEWEKYSKVVKAAFDAIDKLTDGNGDLEEQLAQGRDKLAGMSDAQIKYNTALREANKLAKDALALGPPTAAVQGEMERRLKLLASLRDQGNAEAIQNGADNAVNQLSDEGNPYKKQLDAIKALQEAIDLFGDKSSEAFDPDKLKKYTEAQEQLNRQIAGAKLEQAANAVSAGLTSLQSLAGEGTKAYAQMKVAIDAANIAAAIGAIVNQGMGDPYTAFARIAAMAALMATFVHDIGTAGGAGFHDVAASRQESQGTGTVLGDSKAKSDSIAKATEITANATTQLVGLNRGMLTALQALQHSLGAAGVQLARGAGEVPVPTLAGNQTAPVGSALGNAIIGFFMGGGQKIVDQGIVIAGGRLNDMLNSIVVGAYQTIETNGGLFGSNSMSESISPVADEFAKQFQLVIGSIVDTVRAGATALGLLPADIEAAIAAYKIEEIKISLKGLSAEDQQKALEAVFSSIFDGLAGAVVPFIGQFQKVGEGLGETLVRIATEVQVAQEAFKQLGLAVSVTDPEKFAQLSDALVEATGGLDAFISGMQSFVANFSTGAHQLDVSSAALTSAFEQVGLTVPTTRDGMWELMQSLDATTEAGQAQIATLLRLSDTADAYYNQLDEFASNLGLSGTSDFNRQLMSIRDSAIGLITALRRAGASTETLQHVYDAAATKINELISQLKASAQSLAFSLGLTTTGSLDQVNSEIERLQGIADAGASSVHNFGTAMQDAAQTATDAINLLIGDLSPLNDKQKLEEARKGLMAGAISQDQFLQIARRLFASSAQYQREFAFAQQFAGSGNGFSGSDAGGTGSQGLNADQQQRLADLLKVQQQLQQANQLAQYRDLIQQIAQIASVTGESWQDIIAGMGVNAADLEEGLGLANDDALDAYIDNAQKALDANKDNTMVVADLLRQILIALGGTPADNTGTDGSHSDRPSPGTGGNPTGHSTRGTRTTTDEDADAFGEAVARHLDRPGPDSRRNIRGATA